MNTVKLNRYRVMLENGDYGKVNAPTMQLALDYLETAGYDKLEKSLRYVLRFPPIKADSIFPKPTTFVKKE